MTTRRSTAIVWSIAGLTALPTVVGLTFVALAVSRPGTPGSPGWLVLLAGIVIPWSVIGAVVASRRPGNPIGWLFLVAALGMAANLLGTAYTGLAQTFDPNLPGALWTAWLDTWVWSVFGIAVPVVVFLIFPNGHFLSAFWRYGTIVLLTAAAATITADALAPGRIDNLTEGQDNPAGVESPIRDGLSWFGSHVLGPAVMLFAITAVVLRFHRSKGDERAQIKWVLFTAAVACAGFLGGFAANLEAAFILGLVALTATPIVAGLAILKYRLYEIDRVVNRTVVYGAVTALLAGLYFGIVIGLQQVFSGFTRGNDLAIAGSTLAVAALFRPVRQRIQAFVDRRFYRSRYDAEQTLSAFSQRLRDEVDLDELGSDLGAVVHETMQPTHVSLWLRAPGPEAER